MIHNNAPRIPPWCALNEHTISLANKSIYIYILCETFAVSQCSKQFKLGPAVNAMAGWRAHVTGFGSPTMFRQKPPQTLFKHPDAFNVLVLALLHIIPRFLVQWGVWIRIRNVSTTSYIQLNPFRRRVKNTRTKGTTQPFTDIYIFTKTYPLELALQCEMNIAI